MLMLLAEQAVSPETATIGGIVVAVAGYVTRAIQKRGRASGNGNGTGVGNSPVCLKHQSKIEGHDAKITALQTTADILFPHLETAITKLGDDMNAGFAKLYDRLNALDKS